MRQRVLYVLMLFLIVLALTSCSSKKTSDKSLELREYVMKESDEPKPIKPTVTLYEDKFMFMYSALSSYIGIGTYEIDNDKLILKTDDGKNVYVFTIDNGTLIFNADESSNLPSYANVPDGAVFK